MWKLVRALPVEIIVLVLGQLPVGDLARLDVSWPREHRTELYRTIFAKLPASTVPDPANTSTDIHAWMFNRSLRVSSVQVDSDRPARLQLFKKHAELIQKVALCYASVQDTQLAEELANDPDFCAMVKSLTIDDKHNTLSAQVIAQFSSFSHLADLHVSINHWDDVSATFNLLNVCAGIQKLYIWRWCEQVLIHLADLVSPTAARRLTHLTTGQIGLSSNDLLYLSHNCPHLESLTHYCGRGGPEWGPLKETWLTFARSCTKLKSIRGTFVTKSCPQLLGALMRHCPNLEIVNIGATVIDNDTLAAAPGCAQLTRLQGQWAVDSTSTVILAAPFLCRLTEFEVTLPENTTDDTIKALCLALSYCTSVHGLELPPHPTKFDRLLGAVADHCRALRSLIILTSELDCKVIYESGVQLVQIAKANAWSLGGINIHWNCLTAVQLTELLHALRGAEEVDVTGAGLYLDDDMVCTLGQNCRRLYSVKPLSPAVTDRAVMALANHPKNLGMLDLQSCDLVTEEALLALVQKTSGLYFNVALPNALSKDARERVTTALRERQDICRHIYF